MQINFRKTGPLLWVENVGMNKEQFLLIKYHIKDPTGEQSNLENQTGPISTIKSKMFDILAWIGTKMAMESSTMHINKKVTSLATSTVTKFMLKA